jgi:hypothetical protein
MFRKITNFLVSQRIAAIIVFGLIGAFCGIFFPLPIVSSSGSSFLIQSGVIFLLSLFCGILGAVICYFAFLPLAERLDKYLEDAEKARISKPFEKIKASPNATLRRGKNDYSESRKHIETEIPEGLGFAEPKVEAPEKKDTRDGAFIYTAAAVCLICFVVTTTMRAWFNPSLNEEALSQEIARKDDTENTIKTVIKRKPEALRQSLKEYRKNPDIERIFRDRLEDKRVGGAIAVAVSNRQFNKDESFDSPEDLGFRRITNEDSLVELIIEDKIVIKDIIITKLPNKDHQFNVQIQLKNLTESELDYFIPKGQVFEMRDTRLAQYAENSKTSGNYKDLQGVSSSEQKRGGVNLPPLQDNSIGVLPSQDGNLSIPPMEEAVLNLTAFCINKNLAAPQGEANITIYELADDFTTPESLYKILDKRNAS